MEIDLQFNLDELDKEQISQCLDQYGYIWFKNTGIDSIDSLLTIRPLLLNEVMNYTAGGGGTGR